MWGRTRIGLRCLDVQSGGQARWNVSLPVTVKVYAKALVATAPLPAGAVLTQAQLSVAEIDIAAEPGAVVHRCRQPGRALAQPASRGRRGGAQQHP